MAQVIMMNYDFISGNLSNQCHPRAIVFFTAIP